MKFAIIDPYLSGYSFQEKDGNYRQPKEGEMELLGIILKTGDVYAVDYNDCSWTLSPNQFKIIKEFDPKEFSSDTQINPELATISWAPPPQISLRDLLGQDIKSITF